MLQGFHQPSSLTKLSSKMNPLTSSDLSFAYGDNLLLSIAQTLLGQDHQLSLNSQYCEKLLPTVNDLLIQHKIQELNYLLQQRNMLSQPNQYECNYHSMKYQQQLDSLNLLPSIQIKEEKTISEIYLKKESQNQISTEPIQINENSSARQCLKVNQPNCGIREISYSHIQNQQPAEEYYQNMYRDDEKITSRANLIKYFYSTQISDKFQEDQYIERLLELKDVNNNSFESPINSFFYQLTTRSSLTNPIMNCVEEERKPTDDSSQTSNSICSNTMEQKQQFNEREEPDMKLIKFKNVFQAVEKILKQQLRKTETQNDRNRGDCKILKIFQDLEIEDVVRKVSIDKDRYKDQIEAQVQQILHHFKNQHKVYFKKVRSLKEQLKDTKFHNLNKRIMRVLLGILCNKDISQQLGVDKYYFKQFLQIEQKLVQSSKKTIKKIVVNDQYSHAHYNTMFLQINQSNYPLLQKSPLDIQLHQIIFKLDISLSYQQNSYAILQANIMKQYMYLIIDYALSFNQTDQDTPIQQIRSLYINRVMKGMQKMNQGIIVQRF